MEIDMEIDSRDYPTRTTIGFSHRSANNWK